MTKLTLEQQELLFANDCKLINLRYEYHGYTGTEKWAQNEHAHHEYILHHQVEVLQ